MDGLVIAVSNGGTARSAHVSLIVKQYLQIINLEHHHSVC
jgi:hypothetical protein